MSRPFKDWTDEDIQERLDELYDETDSLERELNECQEAITDFEAEVQRREAGS